MKIAKVTTFYGDYLKAFYGRRPEIVDGSYASQKAALDYDAFGWADFWSHALAPLGYESLEITANALPLQTAWAHENGVSVSSSMEDVVLEQIRRFDPEILFMQDYSTFTASWLQALKEACPSLRLVMGWCGAPYKNGSIFKEYDLVLSCIPELVTHFRDLGLQSEHVHHAFDPRVLTRIGPRESAKHPLSFAGQISRSSGFHLDREKLLGSIAKKLPLEVFSPAGDVTFKDDLKSLVKGSLFDVGLALSKVGVGPEKLSRIPKLGKHLAARDRTPRARFHELEGKLRHSVFGLEMFRTLRDSEITLNHHINASKDSASNMRLFEATGVGTCLLTDWKENLHSLFDPDSEIVAYRSPEECVEKANWLMANPNKVLEIARAGQARTLRDHTFSNRAPTLDSHIRKHLQ